jgi:hypothetical protein
MEALCSSETSVIINKTARSKPRRPQLTLLYMCIIFTSVLEPFVCWFYRILRVLITRITSRPFCFSVYFNILLKFLKLCSFNGVTVFE